MRSMARPWSSRRWSCCCAANSRRCAILSPRPGCTVECGVSRSEVLHANVRRRGQHGRAWLRRVGLLAALAWPQTGAAEGALAIGLPGDVAKEGVAIGWVINSDSEGTAHERALRGCLDFKRRASHHACALQGDQDLPRRVRGHCARPGSRHARRGLGRRGQHAGGRDRRAGGLRCDGWCGASAVLQGHGAALRRQIKSGGLRVGPPNVPGDDVLRQAQHWGRGCRCPCRYSVLVGR